MNFLRRHHPQGGERAGRPVAGGEARLSTRRVRARSMCVAGPAGDHGLRSEHLALGGDGPVSRSLPRQGRGGGTARLGDPAGDSGLARRASTSGPGSARDPRSRQAIRCACRCSPAGCTSSTPRPRPRSSPDPRTTERSSAKADDDGSRPAYRRECRSVAPRATEGIPQMAGVRCLLSLKPS